MLAARGFENPDEEKLPKGRDTSVHSARNFFVHFSHGAQ
jgi:hypothetical protein